MRPRRHSVPRRAAALIPLLAVALAAPPAAPQDPGGGSLELGLLLPTGQRITPAGTQVVVNSLPLGAELSPDGRHLVVLQAGFETPTVTSIATASGEITSSVELKDAWLGLTFSPDGERVYVGGGGSSRVWVLSARDGHLRVEREFPVQPRCAPGCASLIGDVRLDADGRMLYALDLFRDRVVVLNVQSGLVLEEFRTGAAPYRARLTPDQKHLIISHWGEASLGLYRLADRRLVERIPVGDHPTDLQIVVGDVVAPSEADDGPTYPARLFTACAHSDNLWTHGISLDGRPALLDVRSVAPLPDSALGSLPSALGVSVDGKTLFVANAGNNIILMVDIEEALPETGGAVPTAWFPTSVVGLEDGGMAYLSGKGDGVRSGLVSILPALTPSQLEFLSSAAVDTLPGPAPMAPEPPSTFRHVVLVLTDARTENWHRALERGVHLPAYIPPARASLSQTAWLTGGLETDFFAKLAPSVTAGRLSLRQLAAAGRAAMPAAGTLWTNAASRSLQADTYGIAGGRAPETLLSALRRGDSLAGLTVVRLPGTPSEQDGMLGLLEDAMAAHSAYDSTVAFLVPVAGARGAAVTGGSLDPGLELPARVTAASVVRTIGWLLGLRPLSQFDEAAAVLDLPTRQVQ